MKKIKLLVSLVAVALLLVISGPMFNDEDSAQALEKAEILADTLNVRSGPGIDHSLIDQVNASESYYVVDEHTNDDNGEWVKISLSESTEKEGWVSANFVNKIEDDEETEVDKLDKDEEKAQENKTKEIEQRNLAKEVQETPLEGAKIVLDPGHGGHDPGAVGPTGLTEKEVVVDVGHRTKEELEELGADVHLTREGDEFISLFNRANMANQMGADLFISIHANGALNRKAQGTETYYSSLRNPNDYQLAQSLQDGMVNTLNRQDKGIFDRNFSVLRNAHMPAALVELAYLSNYEEEELMRTDQFRQNAAEGISDGIVDYVENFL
ncbi:N-acetylmuramoyl-L-alanine amidase [Natranaerobius trueperi]|uniref:N-acetylmuramoyl-L-alanine amidase n=1 Tax=Natranaerobius trueperi TaxID=759412 RepID=A0A226C2N7_9FIRM|nr:N-acetylmuramoyl-L-alanine amidase [Natranaerobius trueperi]OWZ84650.1 N-acetylmuramoyl-L-alanine amidase [Natranaerobius trueperi]